MGIRVIAASVAILLGTATSDAQVNRLSKTPRLNLASEISGEPAAKACGVTKTSIRRAMMYPLSGSRIVVEEDSFLLPTLLLETITVQPNDFACATSIRLELYIFNTVTLDYNKNTVSGEVILWSKMRIATGPIGNFAQHMSNSVESMTKEFITAWNLANKAGR